MQRLSILQAMRRCRKTMSELQDLAERVRTIMLNHGEPLKISVIARAIGIPQKQVGEAMKLLEDKRKAQLGSRGWRAL